jgi:hypothetical protein
MLNVKSPSGNQLDLARQNAAPTRVCDRSLIFNFHKRQQRLLPSHIALVRRNTFLHGVSFDPGRYGFDFALQRFDKMPE